LCKLIKISPLAQLKNLQAVTNSRWEKKDKEEKKEEKK
jgi:hypothetical protein